MCKENLELLNRVLTDKNYQQKKNYEYGITLILFTFEQVEIVDCLVKKKKETKKYQII